MEYLNDICEKLIKDDEKADNVKTASAQLIGLIREGKLQILDVVQGLNPVLTNGSNQIRLRGVQTLVDVITSYGGDCPLHEKEIRVISEFLCLRLIDHKTMEAPVLNCISYFVELEKKPRDYNNILLDFLKSKINIRRMDARNRHLVFEILRKVVIQKRKQSSSMDSDLVYSFIHLVEGENDPHNLLLCFSTVTYILQNFQNLEPYIDDFFDWLTAYYPIDYTPDEKDVESGVNILKSDLVTALYDCFYSNELNAQNLQTLLIEKLESNLLSTKLESLKCLMKCYQVFPLNSIRDYASSLWTVIRMDCLKKKELVDNKLLQSSLDTLKALTSKLADDDEVYFTFVSDMYEELAIAFRKPEMELFEPAALLLTNAVYPKMKGFNYLISKILPVSLNAILSNDMRPLTGLAYIFEQLLIKHPSPELEAQLHESVNKLISTICDSISGIVEGRRLLNALVRAKVNLNNETLDKIINRLVAATNETDSVVDLDIEQSLALICMNYNRINILVNDQSLKDCHLKSLINLVGIYQSNLIESKLSVYLRLLILILDRATIQEVDCIDDDDLNQFLSQLRHIALVVRENKKIVNNIARIHAIIVNKLSNTNLTLTLMELFKSDYCQKLVPETEEEKQVTYQVYIPMIKWTLKSLIVRNHRMFEPLVNLLLNFISSDKVDQNLAIDVGSQTFRFMHSEDDQILRYKKELNYQVFSFYKQKFYNYTKKEIQIRYEKTNSKKVVLVCLLAAQIPHLPEAMFRQDFERLLRLVLSCLNILLDPQSTSCQQPFNLIYECLKVLIQSDTSDDMFSLLSSFTKLNLALAKDATQLQVRTRALQCLATMGLTYKGAEALNWRTEVLRGIKPCLSDRKRLVRQSAAQARLNWFLLGQPVGQ